MENIQDLTALLKHEIEDLISAEDQLIAGMPLMVEAAKNSQLKKALREHLRITKGQRKRLDKVQKLLNGKKGGEEESKGFLSKLFGGATTHECKGMKGIIEEGNKIMGAPMADVVKDAAIIASAQKQEHYEICGYGTARAYARELDLKEVAALLEETLNEEYEADRLLTELAERDINEKAEKNNKSSKSTGGSGGSSSSASKSASSKGNANGTASKSASKGRVKKAAASKGGAKKAASKNGKK
jgi:ferritin-like metal-binding protein YciE